MCDLCDFRSREKLSLGDEVELAPAAYFAAFPDEFENVDSEWVRDRIAKREFLHNTGNYYVANYCELCGRKLDYIEWVRELWHSLEDVPMDPQTECMEAEWEGFPAGTHREAIWHWLELQFGVSVIDDLIEK